MRGLGAGYTQILINGDPAPQGFALDQLSPSQIERIEVLRAPTADQSAQAIAGTINIILKEAPRRSQRDLRLGLSDGLGRPQGNLNLTLGETKGPWSVSLPLSAFECGARTSTRWNAWVIQAMAACPAPPNRWATSRCGATATTWARV